VPDVTIINSGFSPDATWASRPGAFCPRFGFLGTSVPAAGGIGTSAVAAHALPRVRSSVIFVVPPKATVLAAQVGQPNTYNYMTRVTAAEGEGASGPPPDREPA
jgi:hypothetical protein